jgi:uncharacterized membrane protein
MHTGASDAPGGGGVAAFVGGGLAAVVFIIVLVVVVVILVAVVCVKKRKTNVNGTKIHCSDSTYIDKCNHQWSGHSPLKFESPWLLNKRM